MLRYKFTLLFLLGILFISEIKAQGSDPGLVALVLAHRPKAVSTVGILAGEKTAEMGEFVWMRDNEAKITEYHERLDSYMQKLHNKQVYISQFFGMFLEVQQIVENFKSLAKEIENHPKNAVALSISNQKNYIYQDVVSTGSELIKSITIFLKKDKDGKHIRMKENERMAAITKIVPLLSHLNSQIRKLCMLIECTNFATVWDEITGEYRINRASKLAIIEECQRRRNHRALSAVVSK